MSQLSRASSSNTIEPKIEDLAEIFPALSFTLVKFPNASLPMSNIHEERERVAERGEKEKKSMKCNTEIARIRHNDTKSERETCRDT